VIPKQFIHNNTRSISLPSVITSDEWHAVTASKVSNGFEFSERLRGQIARIRRDATRAGHSPKLAIKWRADLIATNYLDPEFQPEWILGGVPSSDAVDVLAQWRGAGWRIALNSGTDPEAWSKAIKTAAGIPQLYSANYIGTKTVRLYNLVADLRNPDYRARCIRHALACCEFYGLDGLWLDAKLGWHSHRSPARSTPTHNPHAGGVVFPSPYGPGEFEAAFAELIRGLYAVGITPVTVTRPARLEDIAARDVWAWMPDDVRPMVFAEYG
jgi:hypothetical protein